MTSKPIRVAAKAVIVVDGEILLTRNLHPDDQDGQFFLLPGGGQQHGETLDECLRREVCEETGYPVEVGDVLWVRDYVGSSHEFAVFEPDVHQVEVMFACRVDREAGPSTPVELDAWQLSVDWVPLGQLPEVRFFPQALVPHLTAYQPPRQPVLPYLGDVN